MKGRLTILKRDGVLIAKTKTKGISFSGSNADSTTADSAGFSELEDGTAINSVSISVDGLFVDDAAQRNLIADKLAGAIQPWEIEFEGGSKFSGNFELGSLDIGSPHDGSVSFSASLQSSGAVVYAAAA